MLHQRLDDMEREKNQLNTRVSALEREKQQSEGKVKQMVAKFEVEKKNLEDALINSESEKEQLKNQKASINEGDLNELKNLRLKRFELDILERKVNTLSTKQERLMAEAADSLALVNTARTEKA